MARLAESGSDYLCATALPNDTVQVRFIGQFQQRAVVWDATICTLSHCYPDTPSAMPFMEITVGDEGLCQIKVGLNLPHIDEPTIKKTIIMVRNYKRLKPGRHEWG